jgi:hypothetical protein
VGAISCDKASVLQCLGHVDTVVDTNSCGDGQPVATYTERHKQNKNRQTFMSRAVFELMTQAFGLRKTVHNVDRAASAIGSAAFKDERKKKMTQIATENSLLLSTTTAQSTCIIPSGVPRPGIRCRKAAST